MIQEKLLTGPSLASAAGARPTMDPACLRCCRGLYSCHWRQNERGNRRQRCACCWLSFIFLVSLLALIWIYFWVIAYNDRDDVNWKAFTILRRWINWFMVMVIISAVLAIYSCLLLLFALFQIALREPLDLHWLHKVLLLLAVVIITVGIAGIIMAWKREWDAVYLSLQATGPFLQIGGVVALTLLSWFVFQKVFMSRNAVSRAVTLLLFVLVSIIIFVCPCFIKSPCLLERLPSKPALIGHRGAPMMAPENTIMSFRKSIDCGLLAFETDVQLSKDGVPFLMHDCNDTFLQRTTNVKEVFKDREYNRSSEITWKELQELNAGKWFIKSDPFGTVSSLTDQDVEEAQNQSIPSLAELLELAKQHNVSVVFDMKSEKCDDTRERDDTRRIVQAILQSNIPHDLVLWLPSNHRDYVKTLAPGFRHVYADSKKMSNESGDQLNINYAALDPEDIAEQKKDNKSINLWVVNEPWLFSLLWCAGASSVTTNACHRLKDITEPEWTLSPSTYRIIWISVEVVSLLMMIAIYLLLRKRDLRVRAAGCAGRIRELRSFL